MRNKSTENILHGVNEVRLKRGAIIRDGLRTSLTDLRFAKGYSSPRKRWQAICTRPSLFIVGWDRAKLGYFWRHAYQLPRSGRYRGCVVNPASGAPILTDERRLTLGDLPELIRRSCSPCAVLFYEKALQQSSRFEAQGQFLPLEGSCRFSSSGCFSLLASLSSSPPYFLHDARAEFGAKVPNVEHRRRFHTRSSGHRGGHFAGRSAGREGLDDLKMKRGLPQKIPSDNGPEFTSRVAGHQILPHSHGVADASIEGIDQHVVPRDSSSFGVQVTTDGEGFVRDAVVNTIPVKDSNGRSFMVFGIKGGEFVDPTSDPANPSTQTYIVATGTAPGALPNQVSFVVADPASSAPPAYAGTLQLGTSSLDAGTALVLGPLTDSIPDASGNLVQKQVAGVVGRGTASDPANSATPSAGGVLAVVDMSNPRLPAVLSMLKLETFPTDVVLHDSTALVGVRQVAG